MEIERKFMMLTFPTELKEISRCVLNQGYIISNEKEELRIREKIKSDGSISYKLCTKGPGSLIREEVEAEIPKALYEVLVKLLFGRRLIRKEKRTYELKDGLILECCLVDDKWMYCEVEFEDECSALQFEPLEWFGTEITYMQSFKMKNYWAETRGIKEDLKDAE